MKNVFLKIAVVISIVIGIAACYPGGAEYVSDTDIVITNYDPDYNFETIQTYFLSDSIRHLVKEGEEPDRKWDDFIIGELSAHFNGLGWDRLSAADINGGQTPDADILITVATITITNIYSYPWYGGWGYGWGGYPGYGWGYPWYGGAYVSSYETGTVLWTMFDPEDIDEENDVVYLNWEAVINGLVGSNPVNGQTRIKNGINQAFKQSSYLSGN